MNNETILQELSFGNISHRQAYSILNKLYAHVVMDRSDQISVGDLNGQTEGLAFENLAHRCPEGFEAIFIRFDGILDIAVDDKSLWILHAMTTPYYFEAELVNNEIFKDLKPSPDK